jgi:XTP/dITP diphosphohydrolase
VATVKARLASGNRHKLDELRAALPGWELELLDTGRDYPPEDGATYYENARAKAAFGRESAQADEWVFGEDSGIEVAALGGAPGIASARWAADGVAQLLAELDGVDDRRARYVCELVALGPAGEERRGTGILEGTVATERRGDEGFGYDPIFVPTDQERTVAELGDDWKRANSHRARAAAGL